jgi:cell division protein FtsL
MSKNKNSYQNKKERGLKKKRNIISLINKILFIIIIISGISYLVSINDLAIKSFVLEDLRDISEELVFTNEGYELNVMNLESYENINKRALELKMVKVDKLNYLSAGSSFVAKK